MSQHLIAHVIMAKVSKIAPRKLFSRITDINWQKKNIILPRLGHEKDTKSIIA